MAKKRVGIFSLTCDEGCSIMLTEIFNTKLEGWLKKMDLIYFLSLKDASDYQKLDIALVEGVVTSQKDSTEIKKIRKNSKTLIAMGACAMTALPSGLRNNFNAQQKKAIAPHLKKYKFLPKALALKDVVKVDAEVSGCPIIENQLIQVFEKALNQ